MESTVVTRTDALTATGQELPAASAAWFGGRGTSGPPSRVNKHSGWAWVSHVSSSLGCTEIPGAPEMGPDKRTQHLPTPAFDGRWGSSSLDTCTSPLRPSALPNPIKSRLLEPPARSQPSRPPPRLCLLSSLLTSTLLCPQPLLLPGSDVPPPYQAWVWAPPLHEGLPGLCLFPGQTQSWGLTAVWPLYPPPVSHLAAGGMYWGPEIGKL